MDPMLDPALFQMLFGGQSSPNMAIPPSLTGVTAPGTMPPPPKPIEPYMTDPLMPGQPTPQMAPPMTPPQPVSLGASLDPIVPMPQPRPAEAPGGTYAAQNAAKTSGGNGSDLAAMLKGVVVPPPPVAQKVSTPHAPPLAKLPGGNVAELLAQLGIGPQQAFPGLKLPSTLGQALGR